MQPINRSERSRAYFNFMLLFLLCTAIIVTTVFFSTRASVKQNEQLVHYKKSAEEKEDYKKEFADRLHALSDKIDSLDKVNESNYLTFLTNINGEYESLSKSYSQKDNTDQILYGNVMENLSRYLTSKKALKDKMAANSDQKDLVDKIQKLTSENNELDKALFKCEHTPKN